MKTIKNYKDKTTSHISTILQNTESYIHNKRILKFLIYDKLRTILISSIRSLSAGDINGFLPDTIGDDELVVIAVKGFLNEDFSGPLPLP